MKLPQLITLLFLGSLIAVLGLNRFFIDPIPGNAANWFAFILQTAPLFIIAPGIAAQKRMWVFSSALLSMAYFVHGVIRMATPETRPVASWELVFAMGLFISLWVLAKKIPPT